MSEPSKALADETTRVHSIRWAITDLERITEAARVLAEREHLNITMTDLIRSGSIRRAEEILAAHAGSTESGVQSEEGAERPGHGAEADGEVRGQIGERRESNRRIAV